MKIDKAIKRLKTSINWLAVASPDGNITKVTMGQFLSGPLIRMESQGQVDAAGVVVYEGDNQTTKEAHALKAELALEDEEFYEAVCNVVHSNCECFATYCKTGRYSSCVLHSLLAAVLFRNSTVSSHSKL